MGERPYVSHGDQHVFHPSMPWASHVYYDAPTHSSKLAQRTADCDVPNMNFEVTIGGAEAVAMGDIGATSLNRDWVIRNGLHETLERPCMIPCSLSLLRHVLWWR